MVDEDTGIEESVIRFEIMRLMSDKQIWSNQRLKKVLRKDLPLQGVDLRASESRPNELKWENKVNNALSGSRSNSLTARSLVETVAEGEHKMTKDGQAWFEEKCRTKDSLKKIWSDIEAAAGSKQ